MQPTPKDLSHDYTNAAFIAGAEDYPPRWAAAAAAFRAGLGGRARLDLPYGPADRQKLDLFLPDTAPRGVMVYLHGGYWMAFGRQDWSHLAAGALARGWAVAMPSYSLAPQARIAQITQEVAQAVSLVAEMVPGPVVVTGHSAGGHLAARMGNAGRERVQRVVPISPLADLEPLMQTGMNADLRIDTPEAAQESPARLALRCGAHVWVGGQERPAFLWQARVLSESWGCSWTVAAGRHHFDVIDDLADADSGLVRACLDGL